MITLRHILFAATPMILGVAAFLTACYFSRDPAQSLIESRRYILFIAGALLLGIYNAKSVIESTADRITAGREYFVNLRTHLRTVLARKAMQRYISLIVATIVFTSFSFLLERDIHPLLSQLGAPIVWAGATWVMADAIYFYVSTRLESNQIRDLIDKENAQEAARQRLLKELREEREKFKLEGDPHLTSYNQPYEAPTKD